MLNSSCATFAMGQKQCSAPVIPIRPQTIVCISNANGTGQCYDPSTGKNTPTSMENYVCKNISDYNRDEEWIESVLNAVDQ